MMDQSYLDWICDRKDLALTDLEKVTLRVDGLINGIWCSRNCYDSPTLKRSDRYRTNDGYLLGSIVWSSSVTIDGCTFAVYGRTPLEVMHNVFYLFQRCLEVWADSAQVDSIVQQFRQSQKEQVDQIGRFV